MPGVNTCLDTHERDLRARGFASIAGVDKSRFSNLPSRERKGAVLLRLLIQLGGFKCPA